MMMTPTEISGSGDIAVFSILVTIAAGSTSDGLPGVSRPLAMRLATALGGHHGIFPRSEDISGLVSRPRLVGTGRWGEATRDALAARIDGQAVYVEFVRRKKQSPAGPVGSVVCDCYGRLLARIR